MIRPLTTRVGLALVILALAAAPALAGDWQFRASLRGSNEIPANDSTGAGSVKFFLNADETALSWKLIVANTENVTQAHIHCGAPGQGTGNGPVVVFLYGFGPTVSPDGILSEGVATDANVIDRAPSAECPSGVTSLAELVTLLRNGGAYANVHTVQLPGGEIRGQIH